MATAPPGGSGGGTPVANKSKRIPVPEPPYPPIPIELPPKHGGIIPPPELPPVLLGGDYPVISIDPSDILNYID